MSKRLEFLEKTLASGSVDPFHRYAYALELKSVGRYEDALKAFEALRQAKPDYVPQYLMAGGVAQQLGKKDDAKKWLEEGLVRARAAGDAHALSEIQQALLALA